MQHYPLEVHINDLGVRIGRSLFINSVLPLVKYRIGALTCRIISDTVVTLRSPQDLKFLDIWMPIGPVTYKSLVIEAGNLEELHFSYSSLSKYPVGRLNIVLPALKELHLVDDSTYSGPTNEVKDMLAVNYVAFLKKSFPSLHTLIVITMANRTRTIEYVLEFFGFLERHANTLRKVKLDIRRPVVSPPEERVLEYVMLDGDVDMTKLEGVQLEELEVNLGNDFFVGVEEWKQFWDSQVKMTHFKTGEGRPLDPPTYFGIIEKSEKTLVSLHLGLEIFHTDTKKWQPIDCRRFEDCQNLKYLTLIGTPNLENRPKMAELINLDLFPVSLQKLELHNFYLETDHLQAFGEATMEQNRQLEKLVIWNYCTSGKFGITLKLLDSWIGDSFFKELKLKGVNGKEMELKQYVKLITLGAKPHLSHCCVHAIYDPELKNYFPPPKVRIHAEEVVQI